MLDSEKSLVRCDAQWKKREFTKCIQQDDKTIEWMVIQEQGR